MAKEEKKKMTEAEYKLLLKKKNVTYKDISSLDGDYFEKFVIDKGFAAWLFEAADRTETFHHKAKGDTPAYEEEVAISAMTLRRDFARECLKIAKKEKAKKPDWREKMKKAAQEAMEAAK